MVFLLTFNFFKGNILVTAINLDALEGKTL